MRGFVMLAAGAALALGLGGCDRQDGPSDAEVAQYVQATLANDRCAKTYRVLSAQTADRVPHPMVQGAMIIEVLVTVESTDEGVSLLDPCHADLAFGRLSALNKALAQGQEGPTTVPVYAMYQKWESGWRNQGVSFTP